MRRSLPQGPSAQGAAGGASTGAVLAVSVDVDKPPMDGAGAADRASSGLQPPPLPGKDAARSGPRDTRSGSTLGQPDRDADQVAIAAAALRSLLSGVLTT